MTTGTLADMLGATLVGPADIIVDRMESLERATPGSLTFIRSSRFASAWTASRASAALVSKGVQVTGHDDARALLVVEDADLALIHVLAFFSPETTPVQTGVHPGATVSPDARIAPSAGIAPGCTIGPGCEVQEGASLGPNVVLGRDVTVGAGTRILANCTILDRCTLGARCIVHPGVVIGADGFGFHPAPDGSGVLKIPHVGDVRIGNDVEIGANTCIDRAKLGSTIIGDGTKIDNLVQIGHNCVLGRHCLVCGHAGLSGSVTLGDRVIIAGGVGVADNITIGDGATVAARSGVICDVPAGETWGGIPAANMRASAPNYAAFRSLAQHVREIKKLAKRVERLEGTGEGT